jgi:transposase-like protein
MSLAYREFDYEPAKKKLNELAVSLENRYPKAAASLLEGLEETLTVNKLKVPGMLRETLLSTNPIESANSVCRGIIRRVSNFKNGATALRYAAAGFMEAEHGFRRIKGYRQLPFLNEILSKHISQLSETVIA